MSIASQLFDDKLAIIGNLSRKTVPIELKNITEIESEIDQIYSKLQS